MAPGGATEPMAGYCFSRAPRPVPPVRTRYRVIETPIPAPGTEPLLAALDRRESRSMHGQLPLVWDRAEDFSVYDRLGNRWIDFTSTIFVANIGHANPRVASALKREIDRGLLHTYTYASDIRARYLERLVAFAPAPVEKAFLLSAGTEATEAALKLMRLNGAARGKRRCGVICVEGNWHGRTMGAQTMSGDAGQAAWIVTRDPDIHHIPFPYPWLLEGGSGADFLAKGLRELEAQGVSLADDVAGVMLETFQGWGALFYPDDFVQALAERCQSHGILLAFDEMQAGFGRTGRKFGFEHYGVQADLICCGKGMGSGLPLSGVLGRAAIMDLPETGTMSSTHSAAPLVCAAGLATLDEIEGRDLVAAAARKGELLAADLAALRQRRPNLISHCFGKGLIAAVLFRDGAGGLPASEFASRVCERAMDKGLLVVHTGRESIKIGPPLTIAEDALAEGLATLADAIDEIAGTGALNEALG